MVRFFYLKQQQKDGEATVNTPVSQKRASAAQLRIAKGIKELNLLKTCQMEFPDPNDLLNFELLICPDKDFYRNGRFMFSFRVSPNYPHEPPKVKCGAMTYHPNIDLDGNACLNILREDWKPVLTVNSVVYALQNLILEDPLNEDATEVPQSKWRLFEQNAKKPTPRNYIDATYFEWGLE